MTSSSAEDPLVGHISDLTAAVTQMIAAIQAVQGISRPDGTPLLPLPDPVSPPRYRDPTPDESLLAMLFQGYILGLPETFYRIKSKMSLTEAVKQAATGDMARRYESEVLQPSSVRQLRAKFYDLLRAVAEGELPPIPGLKIRPGRKAGSHVIYFTHPTPKDVQ